METKRNVVVASIAGRRKNFILGSGTERVGEVRWE